VRKLRDPTHWVVASGCGHHSKSPYRYHNDKLTDLTIMNGTRGKKQGYEPKRWSIIPEREHQHELQVLKEHCHSRDALQNHRYILPYHPESVQKYQDYQVSPYRFSSHLMGHKKRQAVTLKFQTAGLQTPDGLKKELIFLCVVDYFTGEVLINNVVRPSDRNVEWRTG
jgi:hypothetical protein